VDIRLNHFEEELQMALTYTDEELFLLANTPHMIGAAMAYAGSSGLFGTGKEMFTSAQSILAGVKEYPNNTLIQAILPNMQGDRQEAWDKVKKFRDQASARIKEKGINSTEKLRAQALEDCRAVASLLAAKSSPQEASEYKQWAVAVAEKVAMASTEGGFLGFGGERLSAAEKQLLSELDSALGTTSLLA
jgi:hypothetical protein